MKEIGISIPESEGVQVSIANYLDRETARIDGLIAEKERMLALLEEKRAALISRVVTRGLDPNAPLRPSGQEWLGEIPAHWRLERLKFHLLGLEQGWSPQCDNYPAEPGEWGVLKVGAVNAWKFNPAENKRLPDEIEPLREYEIKKHDVLMSRANTTQLLGSVVHVHEISSKLLLCDKLYRLNVNDDALDREFLVAFLRASPGRFQLEREASGTSGSMQNIGQDTVQNAWIAFPPLDEQKAISRYIADSLAESDAMDAALHRTVDLLRERRAALITAAVTGQIPLEKMTE
jgi:type I restriction enzyme S subunit